MSVARTARRRRKQYKHDNFDQIFGKRHAPKYSRQSASKSARRLAMMIDKQKKMQARKKG